MISNEISITEFQPCDSFFEDLKRGKFVLVLGAGFSKGIKNSIHETDLPIEYKIHFDEYKSIPLGFDFINLTNKLFSDNVKKYQAAANLWEDSNYFINGHDLKSFFRNLFIPDKTDFKENKLNIYRSILLPSWHGIYTFNFDTVIETIVELDNRNSTYFSNWYPLHKGILPKKKETHIAHLHGIITTENLNEIVFGDNGYNKLRGEKHTLYDTLHNDANESFKLFIIGTQFDEESIDDKFFDSLKSNVTIYHFDRENNNFRTKPNIRNNPNYYFIRINETADVLLFLKQNQDKIELNNFNQYLKGIIANADISKVDQLYINLFGQEDVSKLQIESIGIELLSDDFATSYSTFNFHPKEQYNEDENEVDELLDSKAKIIPKVDSILNIEQETQRFIIVGVPGSGKTTTLKKILYQNANKFLCGNVDIKIPVLIAANEFKKDKNFKQLISAKLKVEDCTFLLNSGKLQLLIDGINEIDLDQKRNAYREISGFINEYKELAIILTTRKTGFTNEFNIPVFELKELQESEIREFILKRIPDKLESIWTQLLLNKNILELAYNPLYLTMIVIASKDGIIPKNRGVLFFSFIDTLLKREKLNNIDINSIVDILSEFAFFLKKEGTVSVPNEKAEQIIIDRIKSTHDNHSPFELLDKVNVCNLISISSNTSFIHEAFLDYFSAVKLKKNFNILFNSEVIKIEDLGINDITESIWYEPLIMCGDLFKTIEEEKQAHGYFDLLYKGIFQKNPPKKSIKELTIEDWNKNIKIPCKIAFNLRNIFPKLYDKAEMYLSNYLALWLVNHRKSIEIIPLENIFESIASLSSSKLLDKILYNDNWQEVWLYIQSEDSLELNSVNNNFVLNKKNYLVDAIVKNISDFDTLCELLFDEEKLDSCVFNPIKTRIKELKDTLLRNTSIVNIKNVYLNKVNDLDLLKFISYVDSDFFITHYNKAKWGIEDYVDQLIQIIRFENARDELLSIIDNLNEGQQVKVVINFLKHKYYKTILDWLNIKVRKINYSESNFKKIKSALKLVPVLYFPDNLFEYFFSKDIFFSANYEFVKYSQTKKQAKILLNNIHNLKTLNEITELVLNNTILCNVEIISCDFETFVKKEKIEFCKKNIESFADKDYKIHAIVKFDNLVTNEIPEKGSLIKYNTSNEILFISEYTIVKRGVYQIDIELNNYNNVNQLFHRDIIEFNGKYKGRFAQLFIIVDEHYKLERKSIGFSKINEDEIENYRVFLFLSFPFEIEVASIVKFGFITIRDHWNHLLNEMHPDDYVKNYLGSGNQLSNYNFSNKQLKELARLGLVHKFHKNAQNVNYGIIISKYNLFLRVLSISKKTIVDISVTKEDVDNYNSNQVVVIEKNGSIGSISIAEQNIEKIGYIADEIIRVDYERKEGHIRKSGKISEDEKDYYFHFDDCNFAPRLGDFVLFLPIINVFPSSFGLPKAYRVSKIKDVSNCKIIQINFIGQNMELYGKAVDNVNSMELSFLIKNTSRIISTNPRSGDNFSYIKLGCFSDSNLPMIKLLEKIDK